MNILFPNIPRHATINFTIIRGVIIFLHAIDQTFGFKCDHALKME